MTISPCPASRKSTSARSTPCGTSARSASRIVRARSPSPDKEAQPSGLEPPTATRGRVVGWRQRGRELRQLGRRRARPAPRRQLARVVELAGNGGIGSVRREREVAGALLAIRDRLCKRPMRRAPRRARCLLVADHASNGCAKRTWDRPGEITPSRTARSSASSVSSRRCPCAAASRSTVGRAAMAAVNSTSAVSAGSRAKRTPESSRRPSGRCSASPAAGRAPVRASSRESSSAKNGLPPLASRTRTSSERDSSSESRALRRARSSVGSSGDGISRVSRSPGKARARSNPASGASLAVARTRTGSWRRRRSAIWSTVADGGSSHWRSSSATTSGARSPSTRRTSSRARPIACASGGCAPGWASRSATSSARRRSGGSDGATSSKTLHQEVGQSRERERCLRLGSTARQHPAEAHARFLHSQLPEDRLADPGLARKHERRWACLDRVDETRNRGQLLAAADQLNGHGIHCGPATTRRRSKSPGGAKRRSRPCRRAGPPGDSAAPRAPGRTERRGRPRASSR